MILQALTAYYEQLLRTGQISAPGWENQFKVSYWLRINAEGQLIDLVDCRQMVPRGKKEVLAPREMAVPAHVKRASGIAANFLCDNSTYLLGADEKGKPERSIQCFEACAKLHHAILDGVDSPAARAVLAFFDHWKPEEASAHPLLADRWKDITGNANLLFDYEGPEGSILSTEDEAIRAAWQQHYSSASPDTPLVQCLVTGQQAPAARLHPSIKGVPGAQSSGAALVSFNAPAFCSYGHEQGENAPVSEYAAFAYTTALNTLLADRDHCRILGDTAVVCWAENASPSYSSLGMMAIFGIPENHGLTEDDLSKALDSLAKGQPCSWMGEDLQPGQHFYVLGLSPNAARISVRFFLRDTFQVFAQRLQRYAEDITVIHPAFDKRETLSVWSLVQETVNQNSRDKKLSPQLAGDVLRSILTGTPYPATLLNGAELRIRAEQTITRGRAAIIRAYYRRHPHPQVPKEVLDMPELNEACNNIPYTLGRMFSLYEQIQLAATKANSSNINATIKDRYFNAASSNPSQVFNLLGKLSVSHLRVLRRSNPKLAGSLQGQLEELSIRVGTSYPPHLDPASQGSFQLGYYYQNQARFQKKAPADSTENI